ncbi:MAG: segregation/condensation protein A [Deltaproteobacteria bacterium]|nr:segregation/condensation protein A [Deltaproteobacteria bacterium]
MTESPRAGILFEEDRIYKVRLDGFEGPLDLLLHLIRKSRFDIYDIPIAKILQEYLEVLDLLRELNLDVAGEFLVMAATLAQIKSKMLLPVPEDPAEEGEDPRAELVRRLLEYGRFRDAAADLEALPTLGRDVFARTWADAPEGAEADLAEAPLEASLYGLVLAFRELLKRAPEEFSEDVIRQRISMQDAIREILELCQALPAGATLAFTDLFPPRPARERLVATFLGLLELVRLRAVRIVQSVPFGEIRVCPIPAEEA